MNPHPRMLVVDLDGTALRDDWTVAPEDIEAAAALRDAGVVLTIATGRLFTGALHAASELGITGSVAVVNGSELVDVSTGRANHGHYLPATAQTHVREVLAHHGVPTFLYHSRRIHYPRSEAHLARYLSTWSPHIHAHDDVHDAPDWHGDDIVAVCAAGPTAAVDAAKLAFDLPEDLQAERFETWQGDAFLKIRSSVEDKGTAVVRLAAEHGLTAADVVVVGDWINDLPMFRVAGHSFAMNGSHVGDAADGVLDARRGHGGAIAELARRFWGL